MAELRVSRRRGRARTGRRSEQKEQSLRIVKRFPLTLIGLISSLVLMLALNGTLPLEGIVRWLVTPAYWARVLIAAGLVPIVREGTPALRFLIAVLAIAPFLLLDLAGGWVARRLRRPPRTA